MFVTGADLAVRNSPVELGRGCAERELRTLAIVGSHPAGLEAVPWDDPTVEIWVFNEAPMKPEKYPRWDAVLQIHLEQVYASPKNWVNENYWNWLQQDHPGKTIWMQDVDPRVPNSRKYPLEEVLSMIPYRYLRSSPAQALALAIWLGYQHIMLFGSELSSNTEYGYQAINYAFWIGFAHGRRINLDLRCWLSEFNQPIYGYEGELQLPREYYEERAKMHKEAERINANALRKLQDRLNEAMLKGEVQRVGQIAIEVETVALAYGESLGALNEAERYLAKEDMISRQEFERVSAHAQQDGDELRSKKDHAGGKVEYVWNVWAATGRHEALDQLRTFQKEKTMFAQQTGEKIGVFRENILYMTEYDRRLQAAGGVRALGR